MKTVLGRTTSFARLSQESGKLRSCSGLRKISNSWIVIPGMSSLRQECKSEHRAGPEKT